MPKNDYAGIKSAMSVFILICLTLPGLSQTTIPEILLNGSIKEQMGFIQEKTRIYEDYRAIREDMFQKIKVNTLDSLRSARMEITALNGEISTKNIRIDSLKNEVTSISSDLDRMTRTKNSMRIIGMEVGKVVYNTILWTIIIVLLVLLVTGFMTFKRNRSVTLHTRKEIDELKKEFEAYRKASREAREKMSMAHFNELKKIRGV